MQRAIDGRRRGDDDDAGVRLRFLDQLEDGLGFQTRQHIVEDDDLIDLPAQGWFDLLRIADDVDRELVPNQSCLDESADGGIVVEHQEAHVACAVHAAAVVASFFLVWLHVYHRAFPFQRHRADFPDSDLPGEGAWTAWTDCTKVDASVGLRKSGKRRSNSSSARP